MKLLLVSVCVWVVAIGSSTPPARAADEPNVAYIGKDVVAALVVQPRRVLSAPELEMLPIEVLVAASMDHLGIDPRDVEEAIGVLSLTGLPLGQPGLGAVLHFARPYDQKTVMSKLGAKSQEATHADKKYYKSTAPGLPSFAMPDDRTLLLGTELQIKSMLAADNVDSPLVKLLKQADRSKTAVAVIDFATLRPLVQFALQSLPPLPEPYREFLDLPKLVKSIEITLELHDSVTLAVVLAGNDAAAAERIKLLVERAKVLAREFVEQQLAATLTASKDATEQAMGKYVLRISDRLLNAIEVKLVDERVEIALLNGTPALATTGIVVALLLPAVQAAREAGRRNQAVNELKQIGIALLNHENVYKTFPARAIYDKDGKPLLSWRVKILPFLEQQALYQEFHLDEPWDSEHNRKLIDRMPAVYKNPNVDSTTKTVYLGIAGEGQIFGGKEGLRIRQIIDGTSKTAAVVEADADQAVIWTKPDDLEFDPMKPLAGLGNLRGGGFLTVFCDAHVQLIAKTVDPDTLRALFSYAGREPVKLPE